MLAPRVGWSEDPVRGTVALFPGHAAGGIEIGAPIIEGTGDFTITAWALLETPDEDAAVASQSSSGHEHFRLAYSAERRTWTWCMFEAENAHAAAHCAVAAAPAELGRWTSRVATFHAATRQLRLYVTGRQGSVGLVPSVWAGSGAFTIGSAAGDGAAWGFRGAISDVRTYDRVLNPGEISHGRRPSRSAGSRGARRAARAAR